MVFDLSVANNTILSCFFPFFLTIDLYYFIPAAITQIFSSTGELAIPTGISTKGAKAHIKTHPVIAESKIIDGSL